MEPKLDLKWLQTVKIPSRDCVFGFVRESQNIFPSNNAYFNIPTLISYVILYYYYMAEFFTEHGDDIELNEDSDTMTLVSGDSAQTAFGNILINCKSDIIYEWTMKIERLPTGVRLYAIGIGIDSSKRETVNDCFIDAGNHGFICWHCGIGEHKTGIFGCKSFKEDDIVKLEINTKLQKCVLCINDGKSSELGKYLDWTENYYLAVTICEPKCCVRLIDFQSYACC